MYESRVSAIILSRGSTWAPLAWQPPYLLADPGTTWPTDATVQAVFYDSAGTVLATVDGTHTDQAISFDAAPDVVDAIPAGAGFEILLTTGGRPFQIRYGTVVRREAEFRSAPPATVAAQSLKFTDTFPTLGLRSAWQPVAGITTVHDNSAQSLPNGVGPKQNFLNKVQSAIRWYQPLNSDSVRVNVNVLYLDTINFASDTMTVIVCADQNFTTWLGIQLELSATVPANNRIHLCTGSGPLTATYQGSPVANTVTTGDQYTIEYRDTTKTLSVFKNGATTALASWKDSASQVPHGPGYRYTGINWQLQALENGPELSFWQAMDLF